MVAIISDAKVGDIILIPKGTWCQIYCAEDFL